jgi:hypothetical protein
MKRKKRKKNSVSQKELIIKARRWCSDITNAELIEKIEKMK